MSSSHVSDTPWTREALTPDELAGVEARAAILGAFVSLNAAHPDGPYDVYVSDQAVRVSRPRVRLLAASIHEALDEFREERAAVDEDAKRYTPAEILTIANQSGLVR